VQEWLLLWTAANTLRRNPDAGRPAPGTTAATTDAGYTCPKCGSWVVDTALHTGWHLQISDPQR
jgi:hypothetical protein